jgi:ABC-2 type transport system permease protein
MLTTQKVATSGEIILDGKSLIKDPAGARRKIGVVAQHNNLDRGLTARENLIYHAKYFGMNTNIANKKANEYLEKFGLADRQNDYVRSYSGGMAQRLKIARTTMHTLDILFLDEPSTGLDQNYRSILWEQMTELNKAGTTIFCMLITGIHGTAVPLTMDFNNLREIEDRLMAPVSVKIVALAKMLVGIIESFIGGLIVLPISLLLMGSSLDVVITPESVLILIPILILISIASASLGLLVGTIIKPMQIAAMFPGFLMPVVFLGGIFFSWSDLAATPIIQKIVLINPLIYVNEALRAILTPQIGYMPLLFSVFGIIMSILIMGYFASKRFIRMVIGAK